MSAPAQPGRDRRGRGALEYGFWNPWGVGSRYKVQDGFLHWPKTNERSYEPATAPEIASEFAKLHEGDSAAVEGFARSWGHLGYSNLIADAPEARRDYTPLPEPLAWIWAHARGVRICLDVLSLLQQRDAKRLGALLQSLQGPPARTLGEQAEILAGGVSDIPPAIDATNWPWFLCGVLHEIRPYSGRGAQQRSPELQARILVQTVVNDNLRGLPLALHWLSAGATAQSRPHRRGQAQDGDFFFGYAFAPLITVIYWHVGRLAQDKASLGICEYCGKVFARSDSRQRYCPVPAGYQGRESFCGRNARAARDRAKASGAQSQEGGTDV